MSIDFANLKATEIGRHIWKQCKKEVKNREKRKNAIKRLQLIDGGYNGSIQEYQDIIIPYWKKYGIKPEKLWFDLYCNDMDSYDPRFIPDNLWLTTIIPYFNDMRMQRAYQDKGMLDRLLPDVKKPETIVKNIAGYYYSGDGEQIITREEAIRLCEQEEHLVIKPSVGTHGGIGIAFWDRTEDLPHIDYLFEKFGSGFVVQRLVRQHPDLAHLNESSLNTVRVLSFHFKGKVNILSAQLRIGGVGARVDNVSSGGCACAIKPDGWLYEKSVTRKSEWTDEAPSGVKLKDVRVPNYELIKETVKRLHPQLPYFNIIGWDFAVGEDGMPVFIEFNAGPGQNQIGDRKPTFGDLTDEVLEDVFIKKTLKNAFKR